MSAPRGAAAMGPLRGLTAMRPLRGLFAHFKAYHSHGLPIIQYSGMIGMAAFPLFYLLRFTKVEPPFNDLGLRVLAMLLCAGLALRTRWPQRLQPYYLPYAYATLLYCMPFFFVFTSLVNGGGTIGVANTFMAVFFLVLLSDWRNSVLMLVVGAAAGVGLYLLVVPDPQFPRDYVGRLPILVLVVVGGSVFKFAQKQAEAEKVRRTYTALAGSIAHEMRNPLSQIKHNLEHMQQALPPPTTHAQAATLSGADIDDLYRNLAESDMAVRRGLQVISMTLDEVSARPFDSSAFSYIRAAEATRKAVREYGYDSEGDRDKVSVRVLEDFQFRGDETAYLFVLFNLVRNALYYATLNPQTRVTISVARQAVTVHDNGPGIAPDVLARLFEPFSSAGKSGGTGLGLAYCQRVMLAFGGSIECESVQGQYTQFTLRFPAISESESENHRLSVLIHAREFFAGKRVLVVDDDAAQRLTTRHKLQPLSVTVDEAADGRRALDLLARERYDLVLLDLNMPLLDGYEVAARVRRGEAPASRDARIVAYTSEPAHLASVKTHKAGMDGFISKPCAQLQLVQALQSVFEQQPGSLPGAGRLAGRQMLVADDSAVNRKAVAALLRHAGVAVTEVAHGQAALDRLRAGEAWDAALLDIHMPGLDGLGTARAIRASANGLERLPLVALTAGMGAEAEASARQAGFDAFITKPADAARLYATLERLLADAPAGVAPAAQPVQTPAPAAVVAADASSRAGPAAEALPDEEPLIDPARLEGYRRLGMLEELLDDSTVELGRLAGLLQARVEARDLAGSLETLHSLLGLSGEAGAQGLYAAVRAVYVPMLEQRAWPAAAGWEARILALVERTRAALRAYGTVQVSPSPG